jgi:hypothetical protein
MRHIRLVPVFMIGALLILHGFAHFPAVLGSWEFATFEDVSYQPNVLFTDASDALVRVFGVVWAAAALSFVVAGYAIARRASWWPRATAAALALSLPMTMLWREDAIAGLVINAAVLAGLVVWGSWTFTRKRSPHVSRT